jgi:hypothetical protein
LKALNRRYDDANHYQSPRQPFQIAQKGQARRGGEDIGIVSGDQIVALRPVTVSSDDYAWREYGVTPAELARFEKRMKKSKRGLHPINCCSIVNRMTAKRMVLETVEQLPEDASFDEITRRLEVVAAIQKGLDSLDRGEGKSIDEVEKLVASSWTTK